MLRIIRSMRGLQRRFAAIVLASVLVFLLYLLLSNSGHIQSAKSVQERDRPFVFPSRDKPESGKQNEHLPSDRESLLTPGNEFLGDKHDSNKIVDAPKGDNNIIVDPAKPNVPSTVQPNLNRPTTTKAAPTVKETPTVRQDSNLAFKPKPDGGVLVPGQDHLNKDEHLDEIQVGEPEAEKPTMKKVLPPLAKDFTDPYSGPRNEQQQEIVGAFLHAWDHYKKYAWGHDELKPVSKGWQEWMGVGLTIVDSLDTMYIMGLKDEFKLGRDWVAESLTFDRDHEVQLFEIVIRELGGLLAAYHLSNDKVFLDKAVDLGSRLFPCLTGPNGIPCNRINMKNSRPHFMEISTAETGTIQLEFRDLSRSSTEPRFEVELGKRLEPCFHGLTPIPCFRVNLRRGRTTFQDISTAEVGTIQLEFRALARASINTTYERAIETISNHLHKQKKLDGLVSCFINPHTGDFRQSSTVSVGASADSYYEYLVKQWIQTGKTRDMFKEDYLEAVAGMRKHLYRHTGNNHLGFVGAFNGMNGRSFRPEMEHLACFLPGTLALGYMAGLQDRNHLQMAENLTHTCYQMYRRMPTGLSPEVASMSMNGNGGNRDDIFVTTGGAFNLQRPETVESIFYMYRATKDPKYRQWGWEIFQAFEKYTKLPGGGYASINNVKNPEAPGFRDKMETFYLAETLKYLYLLFSDDPNLIPLDKFVINTEAHPLPVYTS